MIFQFTRSLECNDGTPRPVVNTQNSSLHLINVDGSCTETLRTYGASAAAVTVLLKFVAAAGAAWDEMRKSEPDINATTATTFDRKLKSVLFIGLDDRSEGWIETTRFSICGRSFAENERNAVQPD